MATDIGGTFTDLVCLDEDSGRLEISKDPTTSKVLFQGVINCINKAKIDSTRIDNFVHGSTVAINALLEHKGANACLITTRGFRDVFEIGRGQRTDMFNPLFHRPEPLIPREKRFEVSERIDSEGNELMPLDEDEARKVSERILREKFDSVAICLLNAYVNPMHERLLGDILKKTCPAVAVSLSHEITREYREYERTSTVAINAYITPIVQRYLDGMEGALRGAGCSSQLLMMQSNGGTMSFADAKTNSISMIESGPASGVVGASELGKLLGYKNVISFDMGGTTAKASLIETGEPKFTLDYTVLGLPLLVPFIDLVEVGAGGGSISWIDKAGALKVGPQSAGANPGPVCYGWGGVEPTVTDANLYVGHLNPQYFLGGEIPLSYKQAQEAIKERVAIPLGKDEDYCALGILEIANTIMANAIRAVTVEKGYDPRDFTMMAYGGAGPVHASAIAQELEVPVIVIPPNPAHFSAMGMLLGDIRHDYAQTYVLALQEVEGRKIAEDLALMEGSALERLESEKVRRENIKFLRSIDIRYQGQEHTLSVPVSEIEGGDRWKDEVAQRFHQLHEARYGHSSPKEALEIVTVRLSAIGVTSKPKPPRVPVGGRAPPIESRRGNRKVLMKSRSGSTENMTFEAYRRENLFAGNVIAGPAILEEYASTTMVLPGYTALIDQYGDIVINKTKGQA